MEVPASDSTLCRLYLGRRFVNITDARHFYQKWYSQMCFVADASIRMRGERSGKHSKIGSRRAFGMQECCIHAGLCVYICTYIYIYMAAMAYHTFFNHMFLHKYINVYIYIYVHAQADMQVVVWKRTSRSQLGRQFMCRSWYHIECVCVYIHIFTDSFT